MHGVQTFLYLGDLLIHVILLVPGSSEVEYPDELAVFKLFALLVVKLYRSFVQELPDLFEVKCVM